MFTSRFRALSALIPFVVMALIPGLACANAGGEGPDVAGTVLSIGIVMAACLAGYWTVSKAGFPSILGWIVAGVIVGNMPFQVTQQIKHNEFIALIGELGVVFLMFKSGLEAKPQAIKKNLVGAGLVALLGVVFVGVLGYGVATLMLPADSHWLAYVYVAAALTPTSAGIGAAIFASKRQSASNEGTLVLVAAVLDDVLGLVIMALLGALAATVQSGAEIALGPLMLEAAKGLGFVGVSFFLGVWVIPKSHPGVFKMTTEFVLPTAIVACLGMAFLGTLFGLAPLIGGYAGGLLFEQVRYKDHGHSEELEHAVDPIVVWMVPAFFLLIGTNVPLAGFTNLSVLGLAVALTAATLFGKILSGVGVSGDTKRATVVAGMMPRGEVAGIMVKTGASIIVAGKPLISPEVFTAFVLMIAMTTLLSIIGLNRTLPSSTASVQA